MAKSVGAEGYISEILEGETGGSWVEMCLKQKEYRVTEGKQMKEWLMRTIK